MSRGKGTIFLQLFFNGRGSGTSHCHKFPSIYNIIPSLMHIPKSVRSPKNSYFVFYLRELELYPKIP